MSFSGGCLCGAVRYSVEGEPLMVFHCHCRDCQRHGGSLVHYGVMVRESQLSLEGELASYELASDSGRKITRQFCPTCGSGVRNILEMAPGTFVVKGGTIDQPDDRPRPTFELYTDSKPEWLATTDLRQFPREANAPVSELRYKR